MCEHFEDFSRKERTKGTRVTALVLALSLIISMVSMVFGSVQKTEGDKTRALHSLCEAEAQKMKMFAEQSEKEAIMQRVMAEEKESMARKALEECRQNQKK